MNLQLVACCLMLLLVGGCAVDARVPRKRREAGGASADHSFSSHGPRGSRMETLVIPDRHRALVG